MTAHDEAIMESAEDNSDNEDPKQHSKLLSAISRLDYKQRVKPPSRKEPSIQVSEFHLAKEKTSKKSNAVSLTALAGVLGKGAASHAVISRKVQAVQKKAKTLAKPLEKIVADKVKRSAGFEKTKKVLARWEPIVASNRVADQLEFPLNKSSVQVHETNIFTSAMMPKTDLEKEIHQVLMSSGYIKPQEEKNEDSFPLTLEEVLAQRREAASLRAKNTQQQMKAWRRNRIKSKKFHRVLRRERVRQQIKEFETLKETDPEEALKRLDQLERTRAQERASLRHRNTGPWARNKAVRAKYDRESRQVLAQQLSISRDLTQKVQPIQESSEESGDEDDEAPELVLVPSEGEDVNQFVSGYRKYWEHRNAAKPQTQTGGLKSGNPQSTLAEKSSIPGATFSELQQGFIEEEPTIKQFKMTLKKNLNEGHRKGKTSSVPTSSNISIELNDGIIETKNSPKVKRTSGSWVVTEVKSKKKTMPAKLQTIKKKSHNNVAEKVTLKENADINDMFNDLENQQEKLISRSLIQLKKDSEVKNNDVTKKSSRKSSRNKKQNGGEMLKSKKQKKVQAHKDFDNNMDVIVSLRPTTGMRKAISFPLSEQPVGLDSNPDKLGHIQSLIDLVSKKESNPASAQQVIPKIAPENIDPTKFLAARPLRSRAAEFVSSGLEDLDDMEEEEAAKHRVTIAEAFAEDDVVDDFRKEKADLEKSSKPKEIDLTLPGWGAWGGSGAPLLRRKRKRFILKPTQEAPRRDRNKHNVIIYEGKDSGIMNHQVSELPYPFESVKDFEASIRAPIGSTWIPETAHRKLTAPRIVTRQGQAIAPMTEDVLFEESSVNKKM